MLNIKNQRAHDLAAEVSTLTGESLTQAVIVSLEERLERVRPRPKTIDIEKVEALLAEMRTRLPPEFFAEEDPSAFLYDPDTGLPA